MSDSLIPYTPKQLTQYSSGGNVASASAVSGHVSINVSEPAPKSTHLVRIAQSSSHEKNPQIAENPQDAAIRRRFKLLKAARRLLPGERIAECNSAQAPLSAYVVGNYNPEHKTASYQNLVHCDSFSCPVCAVRRSEEDRQRLSVILAETGKRDLFPVLITLTLQHHAGDQLDELRSTLRESFDGAFSGRWYANLVEEYGIVSKVSAYEVTYGKNGWHPHMHVLMFMSLEVSGRWLVDFEAKLRERWIGQLQRRGFDASWAHGLTVATADSKIADYIAKFGREPLDQEWGADSEMAKAPVKRARRDGLTPLELLSAAAGDADALARLGGVLALDDRQLLKTRAGALYVEYFRAFKGKPRLFIPAKLRKMIDLDIAVAALEAAAVESPTLPMVMCSRDVWKDVQRRDLDAELLVMVRQGDAFMLLTWLTRNGIDAIVPHVAYEFSITGQMPSAAPPADAPPAAAVHVNGCL